MKLNTKIQNAVVLLLDVQANGTENKAVGLKEISERQNLSLTYIEQISRKLRKAKIIESVRGPGGGYVLKKDLNDISLYDIHVAVGEKCAFEYAFDKDSNEISAAKDLFSKLETEMLTILKDSFIIESNNVFCLNEIKNKQKVKDSDIESAL